MSSSNKLKVYPQQCGFLDQLIRSFPVEYQGLLGGLNARWCNPSTLLKYHTHVRVCWSTFIQHLIQNYPVVIDNNLYFKPKILLLPLHLQRNVLSLILSMTCEIPTETLQKLDETMDGWNGNMDGWTDSLHKLLKVKIKQLDISDNTTRQLVHVDIISEKSRTRFQDLCNQIGLCPSVGITTPTPWHVIKPLNTEPSRPELHMAINSDSLKEMGNAQFHNTEDLTAASGFIEIEDDMDVDEANTTAVELNDIQPCYSPDTLPIVTEIQTNSTIVLPEPPQELHIDGIDLNTVLLQKLAPLQNLIQEISSNEVLQPDGTPGLEALQVFCELSSTEMEEACHILELNSLQSESTVTLLCQSFVKLQPEPSYQNTCIFISNCILPRLQKLQQVASRSLTSTILAFTDKYSTALCDSLFIRLLLDPSFDSFQADLISKVIKEKFNPDSTTKLLSLLLDTKHTLNGDTLYWDEGIVTVVQTILDSNTNLDQQLFDQYLDVLKFNCVYMAKSLKFAKLILATIRKYSSFVSTNKQIVLSILERNDTFLKKAGIASLKKLD